MSENAEHMTNLAHVKILVVDDEQSIVELLLKHFQSINWDVSSANTCEQAQALLKNEKFDVILCDLVLGESSSEGLLSKVMQLQPNTKLLLMTGKYDALRELPDLQHKCHILTKPFFPQKAVQKILQLVNQSSAS